MLSLESQRSSPVDKATIIEAFDEWEVLTPTWFEVADHLEAIKRLAKDESFSERKRAALVASKVLYSLQKYTEALDWALAAEELFNLTPKPALERLGPQDEMYVNKIVEQALDRYKIEKREGIISEANLETLINRIFKLSMDLKEFRYVIGLALDTRRIDQIEEAVQNSEDSAALLTETVTKVIESQLDRGFRGLVLDALLKLFAGFNEPDFVSICQVCVIESCRKI